MFKDLLVPITGHGNDAGALAAAATLAALADSHVAVLVQVYMPMPIADGGMIGPFPLEMYATLYEQVRQRGVAEHERWTEVVRRSGINGEVRLAENLLSSPPQTAAMQARYADLSIIGLGEPGTLPIEVDDQIAKLLSGSGRPLLAIPSGCKFVVPSRIVLGWQPSAHAARAVHDAMSLLTRAASIDVLCVDPLRAEQQHGADPGADIARHLARHDLKVTVHVEHGAGDEPGEVLLRRARELGADLLVIGGYSHSRLREWVLGGTTRHVLKHATLPVLLAH